MVSKAKKMSYFQNLYVMAISDNILAEEEKMFLHQIAEEMGLGLKDIEPIMNSAPHQLEFITPESHEEKVEQLESLVLMVMADKKVFKNELDLCWAFAEKNGFDKKEFEEIMKRSLGINPSKRNVKIYEEVFESLLNSGLPIQQITGYVRLVTHKKNPDLTSLNQDDQIIIYQFLWLLFVRSIRLQKELESIIPTYCDLLDSGEKSLSDLKNMLIPVERNLGKHLIQWNHFSLEDLKKGLESFIFQEE